MQGNTGPFDRWPARREEHLLMMDKNVITAVAVVLIIALLVAVFVSLI
ncbi:MAG: hypothetical protein QG597_2357 [Actinomycetota bacterium]|nr:hypothetical protein [Actinomycetota bacterium]